MNKSMPRSSLRSRSGLSSPLRSTAPHRSSLSRDASASDLTTARMPSSSSSPLSCPISLSCPTTLTPMRPAAWVTVTTSGAASRTSSTAKRKSDVGFSSGGAKGAGFAIGDFRGAFGRNLRHPASLPRGGAVIETMRASPRIASTYKTGHAILL
eukprot:scaffold43356_cov54-Phaeocystis_antarctica.AAC.2